jgi:phosphopentomutase
MINRVVLIVMDSLGIGALPDADQFGDLGADTLGHIVDHHPNLLIPNLKKLGFGNIDGAAGGRLVVKDPIGAYGRANEVSRGKDTITGHWEIAGLQTEIPFQTFPDGFPDAFIKQYEEAIGSEVLGNYAASGTVIIDELGPEHEKSGKPIVYTSADSVFQIAANIEIIPLSRLYEICEIARKMLQGEYACGRVIARPYILENGKRTRTSDRRDYAVSPPEPTLLNLIQDTGKTVWAVGKIGDIFNQTGISTSIHTESNADGVQKTIDAMNMDFKGLIFTNLVDFDSKYGHRRDPEGYALAIEEFDNGLAGVLDALKSDDLLILCADHGNDPVHTGWDHTREYIPMVFFGNQIKQGVNLGTRQTFADLGATISDILSAGKTSIGESFKNAILIPEGKGM